MGSLPPSKPPTGPAPPRRSVCAPGRCPRHSIADQPGKGERTMSFHSWLQNLRSALAPGRGQRQHRRRGSPRAATHRLNLEVLEDRCLPSFSPAVSYPVGPNPQAVVTADFNNDGRARPGGRQLRRQHRQRAAGQRRRHVPAGPELRHRRRPASRSRSATSTATASSTSRPPTG